MSRTVTKGNAVPYARPVAGLIDDGPELPWQPPSTLEQTTKNLVVSMALPGPIRLFHQPGLRSLSVWMPAQW
ncbi:MAG: hypothetical protein BWX86_02015 [Verrucomicrobia bacterium ADurb.Bin122]|nr:MAG: hypothetical protein BWX86_02015 [Verrucomicrobia bacterium ADurb.Bin122]